MRRFLSTLLVSCCVVSALIYWVDPRGHYHRPNPLETLHPLKNKEVWTWPSANIDEREAKHRYLDLISPPDTVVFGSSRAMVANQSSFKDSFFNMAVTGASLADEEAFWQHLQALKATPRTIVIFLDPLIFNDANPSAYNHLGFDLPFRRRTASRWERPFLRLRSFFDTLEEFFQWRNVIDALERLGEEAGWLRGDPPAQAKAYRADGSIANAFWDAKPSVAMSRAVTFSLILHGKLNGLEKPFDSKAVQLFIDLLHELSARGIRTHVILPPYQPYGYAILNALPEYRDSLDQFTRLYEHVRLSSPDIHFCDARDAGIAGCREDEFGDLFHFNADCASRLLATCLKPAEEGNRTR